VAWCRRWFSISTLFLLGQCFKASSRIEELLACFDERDLQGDLPDLRCFFSKLGGSAGFGCTHDRSSLGEEGL